LKLDEVLQRLEKIRQLQEKYDCRVVTLYQNPESPLGGMITEEAADSFGHVLSEIDSYVNLLIILHSKGGIAYQGMRVAAALMNRGTSCKILVPVEAKSAATLIALAANKLIMFPNAQLGPVDTQLPYRGTYVSALDMLNSDDRVLRSVARGEIRQCEENIRLLITDKFTGSRRRVRMGRLVKRLVRLDKRHGSHSAPIFPNEAKGLGLDVQVDEDIDVRSLHELYLRSDFCEHDPSTIVEYYPFEQHSQPDEAFVAQNR